MLTYIFDANQRPAIKQYLKKQKAKAEVLEFLNRTFLTFLFMLSFCFLMGILTLGLIQTQASPEPQISACNSNFLNSQICN